MKEENFGLKVRIYMVEEEKQLLQLELDRIKSSSLPTNSLVTNDLLQLNAAYDTSENVNDETSSQLLTLNESFSNTVINEKLAISSSSSSSSTTTTTTRVIKNKKILTQTMIMTLTWWI